MSKKEFGKKNLLTLFHIIAINSNQHKKKRLQKYHRYTVVSGEEQLKCNAFNIYFNESPDMAVGFVNSCTVMTLYWHQSSLLLDQEKHISCEKSRWIKCNTKYSQCPFFSEVNISVVFVATLSYHIHILQLLFWLSFDNWSSGPEIFNLEKREYTFLWISRPFI